MNWISVEDRLPEEGRFVLVYVQVGAHSYFYAINFIHQGRWYNKVRHKWGVKTNPIHWMPLPEPPKEK